METNALLDVKNILWLGDILCTLDSDALLKFEYQKTYLENHKKYDLIILAFNKEVDVLNHYEKFFSENKSTDIFLYANDFSKFKLNLIYNRISLKFGFDQYMIKNKVKKKIHEFINLNSQKNLEELSLKESKAKLRQVESLSESLEKIVEERTAHLLQVKKDEEFQLKRIKNLTRFTDELAQLETIEDLILFIKKDIKKIRSIYDVFFVYVDENKDCILCVVANHKNVLYKKISRITGKFSSMQIADLIGRPVNKLIEFQLNARLYVLAELSNFEETTVDFDKYLEDISKPLTVAFDRLLLEKEIIEYSKLWETSFDGTLYPISIIDSDFRVIRSNQKFQSDLKQSHKDQDQRFCFEIFANRSSPCEQCPLNAAVDSKKPSRSEIEVQGAWFRVQTFPILHHQNLEVKHLINYYKNITEEKKLQAQVLQSEKMTALGTLAGHIAHELSNPLSGIQSLAQIWLTDNSLDDSVKADLDEINKAALRAQAIIKNLSDFTKDKDAEFSLISLDTVIEKTLPFLKSILRSHTIELNLNLGDQMVYANFSLLQQVIFNLIKNACEAIPGDGSIKIDTEFLSQDRVQQIRISDSGQGIPENQKEKIFQPFFSTKPDGQGTGLGLSLCKRIIDLHNGKIYFESALNKGTTFYIDIGSRK
jgi:two-component system NtrC family sensor kinase